MGIYFNPNTYDIGAAAPIDSRYTKGTDVLRDAIPNAVRYEGLTCFVSDPAGNGTVPGTLYILSGGITNSDWATPAALGAFWEDVSGVTTNIGSAEVSINTKLIVPIIRPSANGLEAVKITKADGATGVLIVDTENTRVGVGMAPTQAFSVSGNATVSEAVMTPTVQSDIIYPTVISNDLTLQTRAGSTEKSVIISSVGTTPTETARFTDSGRMGLGAITTPTATLHIKAGTVSASSAPIKLTSGALMTVAEAGAIEFLDDAYYATITTGETRKQIAFRETTIAGYGITDAVLKTEDAFIAGSMELTSDATDILTLKHDYTATPSGSVLIDFSDEADLSIASIGLIGADQVLTLTSSASVPLISLASNTRIEDTLQFKDVTTSISRDEFNNLIFTDAINGTKTMSELLASQVWTVNGSDIYSSNVGNVGIGSTPTAGYKLDVAGSVRLTGKILSDQSGSDIVEIESKSALGYDFRVYNTTNASERLHVNASGYVGINTNSQVDQFGVVSTTDSIYAGNFTNTSATGKGLYIQGGAATADAIFVGNYQGVELLKVQGDGTTSILGDLTANNLSGTNTGDQDLSGYVTVATEQTISGAKTFSAITTFNDRLEIDRADNCLFIGKSAGATGGFLAPEFTNMAIGTNSLSLLTGLSYDNMAIGLEAGAVMTSGGANVAIGFRTMGELDLASDNLALGNDALLKGTNIFKNTAIGHKTLSRAVSSVYENTAVGLESQYFLQEGHNNTSLGHYSMLENKDGNFNTAIGSRAMYYIGGSQSTALFNNYNTALGRYAGRNRRTAVLYNAANSTFIGAGTTANADSETNQTVIGANAIGMGSNTVVLGDDLVTNIYANELGTAKINAGSIKLTTGAALNKVLTSSADGTATWETPVAGWTPSGTLNAIPFYNTTTSLGDSPLSVNANGTGLQANGSTASGLESTALNRLTTASGAYAASFGSSTEASGSFSTAFGSSTLASGDASTAMGANTIAAENSSTAMGFFTTANGKFSTALNENTIATAYASTAIGKYNVGGGDSLVWVATDPLFEIGNGIDAARANALTVLKNGNTTISGDLVANNLSGTNTGDQNLSGYQLLSEKNQANGYVGLDASSKIDPNQLPGLAITTTYTVIDETAQLALTVEEGDVAVRTDENKTYIALNSTNASMADWTELLSPTDAVQSVFSRTGVVTAQSGDYDADQITETATRVFVTPTEKTAITHSNRAALDLVSGTNTGDQDLSSYAGLASTNLFTGTNIFENPVYLKYLDPTFSLFNDIPSDDNLSRLSNLKFIGSRLADQLGELVNITATHSGDGNDHLGRISINVNNNTDAFADAELLYIDGKTTSVGIGIQAYATGVQSISLGQQGTSAGRNSIVIGGYSTNANGDCSVVGGRYTKADSYSGIALGRANIGGGDPLNWVDTDPLFELGNGGTSGTLRSNALTVLKNGNTTINGDLTVNSLNIGIAGIDSTSDVVANFLVPEIVAEVPIADISAVFFDYVVKDGANVRAGTVTTTHDNLTTVWSDISTTSLGITDGVIFTTDISGLNLRLIATVPSNDWEIKTFLRTL